jgi:hypothetical protein
LFRCHSRPNSCYLVTLAEAEALSREAPAPYLTWKKAKDKAERQREKLRRVLEDLRTRKPTQADHDKGQHMVKTAADLLN